MTALIQCITENGEELLYRPDQQETCDHGVFLMDRCFQCEAEEERY